MQLSNVGVYLVCFDGIKKRRPKPPPLSWFKFHVQAVQDGAFHNAVQLRSDVDRDVQFGGQSLLEVLPSCCVPLSERACLLRKAQQGS